MTRAGSEIAFLARALKAPRIAERAASLAKVAQDEQWDHETYLAAVLSEEVSARETHGWLTPVEFVEAWLHRQQLQLA